MEEKKIIDLNELEAQEKIKKLEEKIKELESENYILKQYKDAMDRVLIVSKTDPNGNITFVNDMFCKIAGYSKEELIGKPHNIVRHPDMPKAVFKKMWDTIKNKKKIFKGVIKNRKKDGGEYIVVANIIPILDKEGNIKEYVAIRQDITKQIKSQEEKEKFVNELILFFIDTLKRPTAIIKQYSKVIEKEEDIKRIKLLNSKIKREILFLEERYKIFTITYKIKNKEYKIKIEPILIYNYLVHAYKSLKEIFPDKKMSFSIEDKNIVINSDKFFIASLIETLMLYFLATSKTRVHITLKKLNEKEIIFSIEGDNKKIDNINSSLRFFSDMKIHQFRISLKLYVIKKITDLFQYTLKIEDSKLGGNKFIIKFTILPLKKFL